MSNEQLCEFKPDTNLRPAPLTFQSSLMETHHFYAQFERYVKTSNSLPDGIIYSQAAVNMDKYWLTQIENCGFDKDTNLHNFICLIKDDILDEQHCLTQNSKTLRITQSSWRPEKLLKKLREN